MRKVHLKVTINIDDSFDPVPQGLNKKIADVVRKTIVGEIENEGVMCTIYPNKEFYYGRVTVVPTRA